MSGHEIGAITLRAARVTDEQTVRLLTARLTNFNLPEWRTADSIARADASAMMASVRAGEADDEVLIAERDGRPVGCLHLMVVTDFFGYRHAHLSVIAVTADAEGTGVGRLLLSHAEAWTRLRGMALLTLNVFEGNTRARRLYEKAGFAPEILKYAKPLS